MTTKIWQSMQHHKNGYLQISLQTKASNWLIIVVKKTLLQSIIFFGLRNVPTADNLSSFPCSMVQVSILFLVGISYIRFVYRICCRIYVFRQKYPSSKGLFVKLSLVKRFLVKISLTKSFVRQNLFRQKFFFVKIYFVKSFCS